MEISKEGLEFITRLEGCKLKAYLCPAKVWTIGVGHTQNVKQGDEITKEQALEYLKQDIIPCERVINQNVKITLSQQEFDALVSFIFNIGAGAFLKSTMMRFLKVNDKRLAAGQFDRWNKIKGEVSNGLTNRRAKEKELFLKGIYG